MEEVLDIGAITRYRKVLGSRIDAEEQPMTLQSPEDSTDRLFKGLLSDSKIFKSQCQIITSSLWLMHLQSKTVHDCKWQQPNSSAYRRDNTHLIISIIK